MEYPRSLRLLSCALGWIGYVLHSVLSDQLVHHAALANAINSLSIKDFRFFRVDDGRAVFRIAELLNTMRTAIDRDFPLFSRYPYGYGPLFPSGDEESSVCTFSPAW